MNIVSEQPIIVRGRTIRVDENGLVSLTDIWSAAGFKTNQKPPQWWRLPSTLKLAEALLERLLGFSQQSGKIKAKTIYYTKSGPAGGTFPRSNFSGADLGS